MIQYLTGWIRLLSTISRRLLTLIVALIFILPFQVADYEDKIEQYPSDMVVGETPTKRDAREKAKVVFQESFPDNSYSEKPYLVYLDKENDAWLIKGTMTTPFPKILWYWFFVGTEPYAIIQRSDGKVLAVWRD
jgi:hypothetical protein